MSFACARRALDYANLIFKCISNRFVLTSVTAEGEYWSTLICSIFLICVNVEICFEEGILGYEFQLAIFIGKTDRFIVIDRNDIILGNLIQIFPNTDGAMVIDMLFN